MPTPNSRASVLDDVGDPDAPAGSAPWAKWMLGRAKLRRDALDEDAAGLREIIEKLARRRAWEVLGFADLGSLCSAELALAPDDLASVRSAGPGIPLRKLLAQRLAADPEVKKAGPPQGGRPSGNMAIGHVIPSEKLSSNSAERIVRRLKRDAPRVAADLAAGKYPSARAAAIAAGIVKVPTAYEAALKAVRKLSKAERRRLLRALTAESDD